MSNENARDIINRVLEHAKNAGATAVDTVLVSGDTLSARVRDTEIDFVSQAQERALGIRVLLSSSGGPSQTSVRLPEELALELEGTIRQYIRYILDREVKSTGFLDLLRREGRQP